MANRGAHVLFPSAIERVARPAARHDRSEPHAVQGFLRLRYRSAAPVHVGTGALALWPASELPPQVLASLRRSGEAAAASPLAVREAARVSGRPGLPGSTLRGALRQRHSRMTRSCAGRASGERGPRGTVPYHPALEPCRGREICPTCSLFGTTGFASRVRVSDGVVAEDVAFSLAPLPVPGGRGREPERGAARPDRGGGERGRPGGGRPERGGGGPGGRGGRDSGRSSGPPRPATGPAAPRWIEVIPADTPIAVELGVRNLRAEELGALLAALGCEPVIPLICGAGRGLGFGRLYPEGLEVELYRPDGSIEEADVSSWRKAFADSVDRFPAGEDDLLRELGGEA